MNERFTTLDQVVKDICEIGGDDYDHKSYGKVLKVCVNTLRGFNLYSSTPYVKTEEFEVMPNNTVLLPKNALDVVRVGKKDRCGEIEEIFYSKDLSMDAKNIEEHCQCSGKVQVLETIETGIGDTLCNYVVEDISLCSEVVQPYYRVVGLEVVHIAPEITMDLSKINVLDFSGLHFYSNYLFNGGGDIFEWLTINLIGGYSNKEEAIERIKQAIIDYNNGDANSDIISGVLSPNVSITLNGDIISFKANDINIEDVCITVYAGGNFLPNSNPDLFNIKTTPYEYIGSGTVRVSIRVHFFVNIEGDDVDKTSEVVNGEWRRSQANGILTSSFLQGQHIYNEKTVNLINSPECEGIKSFEVLINGEWIDKTNEVTEQGIWELLNTTDEVTAWRYVDSEGEGEPTPIVGDCRVDLQRQEVSKWVDNNIECDTNGRCKSCGNFVPTYTTAWYGGWYSSAPIYSRQLAQSNLNLPNSGQAYYEQYTARPYPARWGFYNLDLAKGVMRLTHNFEHGEKVVIIYSTDMVEIEGAKVVAVEWFDMLLYRCKELIWNRNSVDGTRQRQLYEREYTRIKKIYNKTTQEEWRRAIMKVKYSGVKR